MANSYDVKSFVRQALICELESLLNEGGHDEPKKYRYHLFILIAVGIEFLGAALDDEDWHKIGKSKDRFDNALNSYSSLKKYRDRNLYKIFRCGMAHVYIPNNGLGINMRVEGGNHNGYSGNQLLLHIEDLFDDFKSACNELINNIDNNSNSLILGKKSSVNILNIPD